MAIYHLTIKQVSRSSGRSSVAAAAYRVRTRLRDERTGLLHDYTRYKGGALLAEACLAPDGTLLDREVLWNATELKNNKPNAIPAREVEVALPAELPPEDQVALATGYARELASRYGVGVDVAVHAPDPSGDERNVHAHILLSYCEISVANGEIIAGKKVKELDNIHIQRNGGKNLADQERPRWAELCNEALERAGVLERVDHRSLVAQGIDRVPGVHLGPHVIAMERRGIQTDRGVLARESTEALEIEEMIKHIEQELAKEADLTPSSAHRRGPRTHDVEPTGTKPFMEENHPSKKAIFEPPIPEEILYGALGGPEERSRRCQAYRLPGRDLSPVETLKKGGLEPAMITMDDSGVAVVLRADRTLGPREREALTDAVQETVPGALPCPIPEHGMVLEAKGVVCTRAQEIVREAEKGRGPDLGL